jgi:hypothetical protein
MVSATLMAALIDIFYLLGYTPFSFELYLGSLLRGTPYGPQNWVLGFLVNLGVGGILGIFYGYCFEYIFLKSSPRLGSWIGLWHLALAAFAVFPFFNAIHEFLNIGLYPQFGLLGWSLGAPTFLLLILGHFCFGASMGTFYGPVRLDRVHTRFFEPGETGVSHAEGGITREEDPEDRAMASAF